MSKYNNDGDFEVFKKSYEKERPILFDKASWDRLEFQLERSERKPFRAFYLWPTLAAVAIFCLLLSNLILFSALRSTQQSNTDLNSRMAQYADIFLETDTVWQDRIVYIRDTLFHQNSTTNGYSSPKQANVLNTAVFRQESNSMAITRSLEKQASILSYKNLSTTPTSNDFGAKSQNADAAIIFDLNYVPPVLPTLQPHHIKRSYRKERRLLDKYPIRIQVEEHQPSFVTKAQRLLSPKGFSVGLSGGSIFSTSSELEEFRSVTLGAIGEVRFSDQIRLVADIGYVISNYQTEEMNPALGIPVVATPGENFIFENVDVVRQELLLSLVLKYQLNNGRKWRPFFYAGYGANVLFPHELKYTFEDNTSNMVIEIYQELENTSLNNGFGMMGGGINYLLNDKLSLQLDAFYRSNLRKVDYLSSELVGGKAAIIYRF